MKRFIRTLTGKTVTFMICIISVCLFAASMAGIFLYSQKGWEFYTSSEEELTESVLKDSLLSYYAGSILRDQLYMTGYTEDADEFGYEILNGSGRTVSHSEGFSEEAPFYTLHFGSVKDESGSVYEVFYLRTAPSYGEKEGYYTVLLSPLEGSGAERKIALLTGAVYIAYALRYSIYLIAFVSLLGAVFCFTGLMYAAGRRPDTEEIVPGPLYKVPYDVLLCVCIAVCLCFLAAPFFFGETEDIAEILYLLFACVISLCIFLGLCMSTALRIKTRTLLRNTLLRRTGTLLMKICRGMWDLTVRVFRFLVSLFRSIPLVWKTALAFWVLTMTEMIILYSSDDAEVLFWIRTLLLFPAVIWLALMMKKLQKGSEALAGGDLSYHTDTKGMPADFKRHAENLNSIASGMAIAVEDRLKSERMKTELITNVSHDIRTPLTSIINYATLIGNEQDIGPKVAEYAEVLVRQSEKLKRLLDDLVEASKASTGNLEVILSPCDASVFVTQAGGEYEEKLQHSELTLVTKQPDRELRILADGRRMWRIFDNLMNNICKYALPGTRVYLSLEEHEGHAVFSFKNTSREALDMTEEELLERFARGDASRHTEGNGLGLSIARSMAELQGGSLRLFTDGDLFKAVLSFPLI